MTVNNKRMIPWQTMRSIKQWITTFEKLYSNFFHRDLCVRCHFYLLCKLINSTFHSWHQLCFVVQVRLGFSTRCGAIFDGVAICQLFDLAGYCADCCSPLWKTQTVDPLLHGCSLQLQGLKHPQTAKTKTALKYFTD